MNGAASSLVMGWSPEDRARWTSITDFGDLLIETGDLDPVYIAIRGARLPREQLARLLVAYWCFYHLGCAAWLSEHEGDHFWRWMRVAAENTEPLPREVVSTGSRWPRSAERRHFRGLKCVRAVRMLSAVSPLWRVELLAGKLSEREVMDEVQGWPLFGPWIAFKAADMMERVWGAPIRFSPAVILMYDEPRKALDLLDPSDPQRSYGELLEHFSAAKAPPDRDRPCGPQEVETVLCKWKSMQGGHYWPGKDIREVREGLHGWGDTADRMRASAPQEVART